jgi:hypothetical protein
MIVLVLCVMQLFGLWYAVGRDRIELRFIEALVSGRKKDEKNARMRIKLARAKAQRAAKAQLEKAKAARLSVARRRRESVALARRSRNESRRERRISGGVSTGSTPRGSIFGGIGAFSISRRSSPDSISELSGSETCNDRGEGESSTFGQLDSMTTAERKRYFGRQPTGADLLTDAAVKRDRLAASAGSAGSASGPPPGKAQLSLSASLQRPASAHNPKRRSILSALQPFVSRVGGSSFASRVGGTRSRTALARTAEVACRSQIAALEVGGS